MPATQTFVTDNAVSMGHGVLRRGREGPAPQGGTRPAPLPVSVGVIRTHGICCGMTAVWARAILRGSRFYDGGLMQGPGSIAQANGIRNGNPGVDMFANADVILSTQNLRIDPFPVSRQLVLGLAQVARQANSVWMLGIRGPMGGHAMGIEVANAHRYFMDPNYGEWCWPLNEGRQFVLDVADFINRYYRNMDFLNVRFLKMINE